MNLKIRRLKNDLYQLEDDGDVIEEFNQNKMTHPDDWIDHAVNAGYDGWKISLGNWEFVDDRPEMNEE